MRKPFASLIPRSIKKIIRRNYYRLKYKNVLFKKGASASNSFFEGYNILRDRVSFRNSYLGYGSYISENTILNNIEIGRYCCIGSNVKNGFGLHPSNTFVSIHPAFYSTVGQAGFTFVNKQKFEEHSYVDYEKKYINKIGNDVWVGSNVIILEGITIGDGAIIATGAVVTKDIKPYSIVGGVPAKQIKFRFNQVQISWLLNFQWWKKSTNWIQANSAYFEDIEKFIDLIRDYNAEKK